MKRLIIKHSTKQIQPVRCWCATVKRDCANCIHLILPLRRPGSPGFFGSQSCDPAAWLAERQLLAGHIESNPGPKPTLKTLLHTLTLSPTLTKYTNSPIQPSQSSLSPAHAPPNSPTSVPPPSAPLQNTPTYHRASIQMHLLIYLKQHTGPLDASREGGAFASQVERTHDLLGCRTPPQLHAGGVGRQQQQLENIEKAYRELYQHSDNTVAPFGPVHTEFDTTHQRHRSRFFASYQ